ncbi:hypothetical protein [Fluviicola sp.]|uniref:hypothetical protein n=1 Tax=Fluviicola sp. TaxID=1917219 RepID=UPI003D2B8284
MNKLKKIMICFFIVGIVSPTGFFHFVIELPEVVAHYEHHNKEHQPVGFLDFLMDHATDRKADPEHKNLPFNHNHSSNCYSYQLVYIPANNSSYHIGLCDLGMERSVKINYSPEFALSEFAAPIWQPPQLG